MSPPRGPAAFGDDPVLTGRTPSTSGRADDVYGFLSSFTAGVQRGLDEAEQAAAEQAAAERRER
ncbi:MAG TPA: hypothetical protein VJM49_16610 [Acidimicrobiales bacterium]|nr:hypothetical protein [Acidimicrobiales bacterium]